MVRAAPVLRSHVEKDLADPRLKIFEWFQLSNDVDYGGLRDRGVTMLVKHG